MSHDILGLMRIKIMADKKGQIQNAETIIVIIIVTILMVIGAVFAIRYK